MNGFVQVRTEHTVADRTETTSQRKPVARLLLPKAPLSNCLFGAIVRDIRDCNLPAEQRFSYFASSPLCAISWTFSGQGHLLENEKHAEAPGLAPVFPRVALSGPYDTPQTSWASDDFYAMTLAFYPDAFAVLTGLDPRDLANRSVSADEVLPRALLQLVTDVDNSCDAESGFRLIESHLTPVWTGLRPEGPALGHLVSDWFRALALRAAFSGFGKSTRQIERRVRSWTGYSRRRLSAYVKSEKTFEYALNANASGELNLADMAADLGYSDQSHMGRQVKEATGFSPAEFMKRYNEDECFWCFRLMGERF